MHYNAVRRVVPRSESDLGILGRYKMSTRTEKNTLKRMSKDRSFRVEKGGDANYGIAEGFKAKRLMIRGSKTAAGSYLFEKGVHLPTDAINRTARTFFRGNSEYTFTQSGGIVRLRKTDGSLTERGKQMYTTPEITVEVPALQVGTNKLNEQYRIPTYKVFTENEYPEIGEVFRRTPGSAANRCQAVKILYGQVILILDFILWLCLQGGQDPRKNTRSFLKR